jgi:hypothetical protein
VHSHITTIWGKKKVILRRTERAVTPFGGLAAFVEFLRRLGLAGEVANLIPFRLCSPNAIPPAQTFIVFLIAVLAGARRFAHALWLRGDAALRSLLGLARLPSDDTIRNFFRRFSQGDVYRFYEGLWRRQLARLPARPEGWSLDLDSTVFERYGRQEGAARGYNPRKPGRPSHHPLVAALAEGPFILHGRLRSGNCGAGRGSVEFLSEAPALLGPERRVRVVRGDSGFSDQKLFSFLEERSLPYIVVARLTQWVKRAVCGVREWRALGGGYEVGEFRLSLWGWERERRFVVVREELREGRERKGRLLFDCPSYAYRVFVTNTSWSAEAVWRDYNRRAALEGRIGELKSDLAADDFCMRRFYPTEAAFKAVLFLFNLLVEFRWATGMVEYQRAATLRAHVFICGAILGRSSRRLVLFLSASWGGLEKIKPLLDRLLKAYPSTSPKLEPDIEPSG